MSNLQKSAPYDARAVANYILDVADQEGVSLTQISLLKILYFSHGWYLATNDVPLVSQPVESWKHGPVIKVVRDAFKTFGGDPITARAEKIDIRTGECLFVKPDLSESDKTFVNQVFRTYSGFGAWRLSHMTHEKESPWYKVWNSEQPVGRLGLRLRNTDIKNYFSTMQKNTTIQ